MSGAVDAIGFVGVGNMGGAMAARVLAVGGEVVVFDQAPAARTTLLSPRCGVVSSAPDCRLHELARWLGSRTLPWSTATPFRTSTSMS